MKALFAFLIFSALAYAQTDSTLVQYEARIVIYDSLANVRTNQVLSIPDEMQMKKLALEAREFIIKRDMMIEAREIYLRYKKDE
jgi:hypothetical protein